MVVRESETKFWQALSLEYMSEESDDPDDSNSLIVHKLPWCSLGKCRMCIYAKSHTFMSMLCNVELTRFMGKLDARYEEKIKKDGILVARKNRKVGSPSQSSPPSGAPGWTIDPKWTEG